MAKESGLKKGRIFIIKEFIKWSDPACITVINILMEDGTEVYCYAENCRGSGVDSPVFASAGDEVKYESNKKSELGEFYNITLKAKLEELNKSKEADFDKASARVYSGGNYNTGKGSH
jgi:hypothetical protein